MPHAIGRLRHRLTLETAIRTPDGGVGLTRDGALQVDGNRRVTTASGALLQPPLTIPEGVSLEDVKIEGDGTVRAGDQQLGRIEVVNVRAPQGLQSIGDNLFAPTATSPRRSRPPSSWSAAGPSSTPSKK